MPVQNEHNSSGTIIIGYQGIGKSSTVNKYDFMGNKINSFIDLESSSFRLPDGSRHDDWYKYYINIALDLASQGHNVFISSHNTVREELAARIKSLEYNLFFDYLLGVLMDIDEEE